MSGQPQHRRRQCSQARVQYGSVVFLYRLPLPYCPVLTCSSLKQVCRELSAPVRTFCSHHIGFLQVSVDADYLTWGHSPLGNVGLLRGSGPDRYVTEKSHI